MPSRDEILHAKILVVDDSADNVDLMLEILREAGYTNVASTMLPEQVCPMHRQQCYDLILLDLQMPGLNGFEFADHYALLPESVRSRIKLFMISSTVDPNDIARAERNPFIIRLLPKPLDLILLRSLL